MHIHRTVWVRITQSEKIHLTRWRKRWRATSPPWCRTYLDSWCLSQSSWRCRGWSSRRRPAGARWRGGPLATRPTWSWRRRWRRKGGSAASSLAAWGSRSLRTRRRESWSPPQPRAPHSPSAALQPGPPSATGTTTTTQGQCLLADGCKDHHCHCPCHCHRLQYPTTLAVSLFLLMIFLIAIFFLFFCVILFYWKCFVSLLDVVLF